MRNFSLDTSLGKAGRGHRIFPHLPPITPAANYALDVTPARLVTSLIIGRGICRAARASIMELFPEMKRQIKSEKGP